jgi:hypothetical protein
MLCYATYGCCNSGRQQPAYSGSGRDRARVCERGQACSWLLMEHEWDPINLSGFDSVNE